MTPLMEEAGGEEEDVDVDEDSEHLPRGITWVTVRVTFVVLGWHSSGVCLQTVILSVTKNVCMCIYKQHTLILRSVCYAIISDICLPEITTLVWICFLYSSGLLKPCCIFWRGTSAQGCLGFLWRWRMLGYWYVASPLLLWRRVNDKPRLDQFLLRTDHFFASSRTESESESWIWSFRLLVKQDHSKYAMKTALQTVKIWNAIGEHLNAFVVAKKNTIGFVCFHHHILILTV